MTTFPGLYPPYVWAGGTVFGISMLNWTAESFTGDDLKPFGMMQFYIWLPLIIVNIYTLATYPNRLITLSRNSCFEIDFR